MKHLLMYKTIFLISMSISALCSSGAFIYYVYMETTLDIAQHEKNTRLDNYYAREFASCNREIDLARQQKDFSIMGAIFREDSIKKEMKAAGYNKADINYIEYNLSNKYYSPAP